MGAGDYIVTFVDQANRLIHEAITSGVPRVGDTCRAERQPQV
jgi:hypothetical protein